MKLKTDSKKNLIDIHKEIENAYKKSNYITTFLLLHFAIENNLRVLLYFTSQPKVIVINVDKWKKLSELKYYTLIRVCFVIGILNKTEFDKLNELNKARNYYAHSKFFYSLFESKQEKKPNVKRIYEECLKLSKKLNKQVYKMIDLKSKDAHKKDKLKYIYFNKKV